MAGFLPRVPLLRLVIPLIAGIIAQHISAIIVSPVVTVVVLLACMGALLYTGRLVRGSFSRRGIEGFVIIPALFVCGFGVASVNESAGQLSSENKNKSGINIFLLNDPVIKERSVKLVCEMRAFEKEGKWIAAKEKILVYLQRDPAAEKLKYGDDLLIVGKPEEIAAPHNPEEFNYREFLSRQHIHEQAYIKTGEWKLVSGDNGNYFKSCALDLRRYFMQKLSGYGFSPSAYGVAAALLLGSSDYLDPGTLQSYSASGTLHVLSVSGMHVALVYIVLLKLLLPLKRNRKLKGLHIGLQLLFIWFYAMLTGLCPSVMRSVMMLTIVILGNAFDQRTHILNSLAASALLLLLFDPLLIFDIGFQLSYLAVAGIVMFQPKLEAMWDPGDHNFFRKIMGHLWTLVTVTIVAQIFTFPLGLYYFHQFPTWFILSNLVVIPLSTVVMYAGLFLLIISPFAIIAKPVAALFGFLVELLNGCVAKIEKFPLSVLHSSKWEINETMLLYLGLIMILLYFIRKRNHFLRMGLAAFSVMMIFVACRSNGHVVQRKIIFFDAGNFSAIGCYDNGNAELFADSSLLKTKGAVDFHILPFFEAENADPAIRVFDSLRVNSDAVVHAGKSRFYAFGKQFLVIEGKRILQTEPSDKFIFLHNSPVADPATIIGNQQPEMIIADGSDKKYIREKWRKYCEERKIPFYDVKEKGALVLEP